MITHFECSECVAVFDRSARVHTCDCGAPVLARYRGPWRSDRPGLWRYRDALPITDDAAITTLGEGATPLLRLSKSVWLKDESTNPTFTFKARGLCVAISRARELGARHVSLPTAGNAGGAAAAYAAAARMRATVFMPADTPKIYSDEVRALGGTVKFVKGHIGDAGKAARAMKGTYDVTTFREPGRVEGKKTIGFEIYEQFGGWPDAIVCPVGGGVAVVGIWKAVQEIGRGRPPKMIAVQAAGCAPIVTGKLPFPNPRTIAFGLRVPNPFAAKLIFRALRESGGRAIAVTDAQILRAQSALARASGVWPCPEGAASWAALPKLRGRVVLLNTGAGVKR